MRIPNRIADVLVKYNRKKLSILETDCKDELQDIYEAFKILQDSEIIFFTRDINWFPKMKLEWDCPNIIDNSIIDYAIDSEIDYQKVINELKELGCCNFRSHLEKEEDEIEIKLSKIIVKEGDINTRENARKVLDQMGLFLP